MITNNFQQNDSEYLFTDRFELTHKFHPCPVCGDISGRCLITRSSLILCTRLEGDQPGFAFQGKSRHGVYSKYYPVASFIDWKREAAETDWRAGDKEDVENLDLPGDEPHLKRGQWDNPDTNYGEEYDS